MHIGAIPTEYRGVHFRSRLEARWACWFDLVGWPWTYEPLELSGYIPDFLVGPPPGGAAAWRTPALFEVKGVATASDLYKYTTKIEASGWQGIAWIAATPKVALLSLSLLGPEFASGRWYEVAPPVPEWQSTEAWVKAGNQTQWQPRARNVWGLAR